VIRLALAFGLLLAAPSSGVAPAPGPPAVEERTIHLPIVGDATVYLPAGEPGRTILFVSGDDGWGRGVVDMARRAARGASAAVAGLSYPALRKAASQRRGGCWYPAGDLEVIGQSLEKQLRFPEYSRPLLLGYSSGATLVYAALAASSESFSGGMSLGFCPDLERVPPLCAHDALRPKYDATVRKAILSPVDRIAGRWEILQGELDKACTPESTHAFARNIDGARVTLLEGVGHGFANPGRWSAAFDDALAEIVRVPDAEAASSKSARGSVDADLENDLDTLGLPLVLRLVERPRAFLLFISGDGGWSSLDKTLVDTLAEHGVSTVAINTLKYFWSEKTPDQVATDLERLVKICRRDALPLFAGGYSFGAEVVPVVVDRPGFKDIFHGLVLISPGPHASFEVSVMDWLRRKEKPTPYGVLEHARALGALPIFCSAGEKDEESICPDLRGEPGRVIALLPGAHHYSGQYDKLAAEVAGFLNTILARGGGPEPRPSPAPTE
jgi:type IV secretory pathway VirJ component